MKTFLIKSFVSYITIGTNFFQVSNIIYRTILFYVFYSFNAFTNVCSISISIEWFWLKLDLISHLSAVIRQPFFYHSDFPSILIGNDPCIANHFSVWKISGPIKDNFEFANFFSKICIVIVHIVFDFSFTLEIIYRNNNSLCTIWLLIFTHLTSMYLKPIPISSVLNSNVFKWA